MQVKLVSHINADGDLLPAWAEYYLKLGVTSFHLIVHGPDDENAQLLRMIDRYPIVIEDAYQGVFSSEEKQRRINGLLQALRGDWILLVDSDEFVELPYGKLSSTIDVLTLKGANAFYAPMIQRLTKDGSLESRPAIDDPFTSFPLCSPDLYRTMGVEAELAKYPLFFCSDSTVIADGGFHHLPNGTSTLLSPLQGVTHHFKWRKAVLNRLLARASSSHTWRSESAGYLNYLATHGYRLPTDGSFLYSREELFQRRFLRDVVARPPEHWHEAYERIKWWEQTQAAAQELASVVGPQDTLILVDEDQFGAKLAADRRIPFLEKDGQYWGAPPDGQTAVRELERLRRSGAGFIAFVWPCFWWLSHYTAMHRYLRSTSRCILENDRLVVFDLRGSRHEKGRGDD